MRLMLVAVDTPVEHTEDVNGSDEALGLDRHTGHPIPVAVRETVVKAVPDTEHDNGDNIDRICGRMRQGQK